MVSAAHKTIMPIKNLTLGLCLVCTGSALARDVHYRVQPGDDISSIAKKFHVGVKKILHVNDLMPDHHLRVGHYLMIPGAVAVSDIATVSVVPKKSGYVVRNGDFDWAIAARNHLSLHRLHLANPGVDWDHLKVGLCINVPGTATAGKAVAKAAKPHGWKAHWHYVAKGETAKSIAHLTGTSLSFLHTLNAGADLRSLKPGDRVRVPGALKSGPEASVVAALVKRSGPATETAVSNKHWKAHWHLVANGESFWIIAHKAGIKVPLLKEMNPGVDLQALHLGEKIRVPGAIVPADEVAIRRIYSSHVVVAGDNVSVRREAGKHADLVCAVDQGTRAAVISRDGNWYQLKFPKGTVGWVRGDHLKPLNLDLIAREERAKRIEVAEAREEEQEQEANAARRALERKHEAILARREREAESHQANAEKRNRLHEHYVAEARQNAAAERLHHEHMVALMAAHEKHLKAAEIAHEQRVALRLAKRSGHVHGSTGNHSVSSDLMALDTDADGDGADGIIHSARKMMGARYHWGSASRGQTDCSGYTMQVYGSRGIHLPRVSRDQANVGQRVAYNDLKPGDLLFFHTMRGHRVTHVAIYVGGGKFLHASSRGGHVQENSLRDNYYSHHLVGARRVLKHKSHALSEESAGSTSESQPAAADPKSGGSDDSTPSNDNN